MRKDFIKHYKNFIDTWGIDSQLFMCIEEMSELTKELCKYKRNSNGEVSKEVIENIKEEIADVLNTAEQLEYFFGEEEIEKIRQQKIDRTIKKYNLK